MINYGTMRVTGWGRQEPGVHGGAIRFARTWDVGWLPRAMHGAFTGPR